MSDDCESRVGRVVTGGKRVTVEFVKTAACKGCGMCAFGSKKRLALPAVNEVGAEVGDMVEILPSNKPVLAFLSLFVLPLLGLIAALLVASRLTASEPIIAAITLAGLIVGLALTLILDRLIYSRKYAARVTKILKEVGENTDDRP